MTVPEIIAAITPYTGHFPKAAVQAAVAQREEVAPYLVRSLEEVAESPEKFVASESMLPLFASYLLAQFRDKRAYRPLTRILATPGKTADRLFGDTITERLENILASVYDGDPEPIKRLVEGKDVYDFIRGAAVDTFLVLTHTGQIPREEVVDYYRSLFQGKLLREYNQVWNALACAVGDLPAPELIGDLRKIFEDGLVDHVYSDLAGLERDARVPFEKKERWKQDKLSRLVSDTVSEMSCWAAFDADDRPKRPVSHPAPMGPASPPPAMEWGDPEDSAIKTLPSTGLRRGPKIGRNAPCPCGSGKKYKKCCLGK